MRIGIIAALPGELKPLVKGWKRVKNSARRTCKWVLRRGEDEWIAVCAGMGADAAQRAFVEAERDGALEMVLSVGWVGALHNEVPAGTAQVPTLVIDSQTGEQFSLTQGKRKWRLVTAQRVADAKEKARLAATYPGAVLVDMEAATVARMAAMREIPLLCIKGVSDAVDATLPDLNPFIDHMGQMKMLPFLASIALRPRYWPPLMRLGRNSARAAVAMRDLILEFMEEKNVEKLIRSGSV
ncbi:MAG TPA: nucleoside phosphorylase [Edaphobacter sp.]